MLASVRGAKCHDWRDRKNGREQLVPGVSTAGLAWEVDCQNGVRPCTVLPRDARGSRLEWMMG